MPDEGQGVPEDVGGVPPSLGGVHHVRPVVLHQSDLHELGDV